ncbi:MAG: hypothetical protein WBX09_02985, partial [Terracidiphilus sp.]
HWAQCHSEYYLAFRGRSEKEIALASAELRRQQQCHSQGLEITAKKLAAFLASVESEEALLLQRQRDRESCDLRNRAAAMSSDDRHGPDAGLRTPVEDGMERIENAPTSCEIYGEF